MSAGAFHGDPAIQRALLDRVDHHIAAGTLVIGGTTWNGSHGSPLGVAIEGDDPADYAERYGFPLPLAALMDPVATTITNWDEASRFLRDWTMAPRPGADLSSVCYELVTRMLAAKEAQGIDDAMASRVLALHRREAAGDTVARSDWSALRADIADLAATDDPPMKAATLALWEACSWPAARGRSTLAFAYARWAALRAQGVGDDWTPADAARAQAMLKDIWDGQSAARDADEPIDYPALFAARDEELAARFSSHLQRSNDRYLASGPLMARWCLTLFAEAPSSCAIER